MDIDKPYFPRLMHDEFFNTQEIIRQLHYSKLDKIKQAVSKKIDLLSELGVKNCVSCRKPVGLTLKSFIIMVICLDCFDNPVKPVAIELRKEWCSKEE